MSDRFAAQITIGGCISRSLVPGLCNAVCRQCVTLDWGGSLFQPHSVSELFTARRSVDGQEVLQLFDDEAFYGQFHDLEAYLMKRRIPFDRLTEGKYDHSPAFVAYRPDAEECVFEANHDGRIVVPAESLWDLTESLAAFGRHLRRGPRAVLQQRHSQLLAELRRAVPDRPTPLPSFEIGKSVGLRNAA